MIRQTMKMLLVALVAACALGATAEAAPRKVVRPRAKHLARVSSGNTAIATRRPAAKKRSAAASAAKRRTQASASTTKKPATRRAAKRKPATKPS